MKQLKQYKHFLMRLLNLVLIVGVCFAYHNIATIRAEKEAKIAAENSGSGSWKDGTYEGSGQGFGGQIVVSVTIMTFRSKKRKMKIVHILIMQKKS